MLYSKIDSKAKIVNVSVIRDVGLCMGCGTCESVCPVEAIQIKRDSRKGVYLPDIDYERCIKCSLCLKVCPGESVNIGQLSNEFLDGQIKDETLGTFNSCYVGHACSQDIRYNSASGGLVTAFLIYALETKIINGALVLGMSESNPLETKPYIATTADDIISASGSKYCPSAINFGLREMIKSKGNFAVVGLPCHLHAIRKWEIINKEIREKIVLHLGIFCANSNTYLGTEYFLRNNGIYPEDVSGIRYRGEGWPGKITITLHDNTKKVIPRGTTEKKLYRKALFSSAFHYDFMIPRCLVCVDQTCELADISFGDPWLKEYTESERIGKSLVITRNHLSNEFLIKAKDAGVIDLEDIPISAVKRAQNYGFKAGAGGRIHLRQALNLAIPDYGERNLSHKRGNILSAFRYLPSYFSHHRWLWSFISFFAIVHFIIFGVLRKIKSKLK